MEKIEEFKIKKLHSIDKSVLELVDIIKGNTDEGLQNIEQLDKVEETLTVTLEKIKAVKEREDRKIQNIITAIEQVKVGPQGEKGDRGERGEKGDQGERGIDGKNGKNGKDGKDGIDGKNATYEEVAKVVKEVLPKEDTIEDLADKIVKVIKDKKLLQATDIRNFLENLNRKQDPTKGAIDQRWHGSGYRQIVYGEVPTGTIDGVNDTFTLAHAPKTNTLMLTLNGAMQTQNIDYTLSGSTITFVTAPQNVEDAVLRAIYYEF